ncbi:hypothetical protein VUR80DRAFT_3879 [Thermomyces stellatus]
MVAERDGRHNDALAVRMTSVSPSWRRSPTKTQSLGTVWEIRPECAALAAKLFPEVPRFFGACTNCWGSTLRDIHLRIWTFRQKFTRKCLVPALSSL